MGSLSVFTHKGLAHWTGLLLVVSLLNYWCPPTTAQLTVLSTRAAVGENVTLYIDDTPHNVTIFVWYRGEGANPYNKIETYYMVQDKHVKGPAYSGREEITHDGSLLLTNVTLNDTGKYTVEVHSEGSWRQVSFGKLEVYVREKLLPVLLGNLTRIENKTLVELTCYTDAVSIQWLFNGTDIELSERKKLSKDHRILTIYPTQWEDVGYFQCVTSGAFGVAKSWTVWLNKKHK